MTTGENLCLACGLCCDGTLFDNVRLGAAEGVQTFKQLGLPVKWSRARAPVAFVRQPCAALCADRSCRVYANRPAQCRAFECRVYKEAEAGRISAASALRRVKQAQRKAEQARRLLRDLGDAEEGLSLSKRFQRVKRRLEAGGADEAAAEAFGKLGLAMHQLDLLAHRYFHTQAEAD